MGNRLSDYENTSTSPCRPYFGDHFFPNFTPIMAHFIAHDGTGRRKRPLFTPLLALCLCVWQGTGGRICPRKTP